MEYVAILILGFWLGGNWTLHKVRKQIYQIAKEKGIDITEKDTPKVKAIPLLTVEKHGDVLYLFESNSNNFMCQGISIDELADKLLKYKNIDVAFVNHNDECIWFIKGKVAVNPNEN